MAREVCVSFCVQDAWYFGWSIGIKHEWITGCCQKKKKVDIRDRNKLRIIVGNKKECYDAENQCYLKVDEQFVLEANINLEIPWVYRDIEI